MGGRDELPDGSAENEFGTKLRPSWEERYETAYRKGLVKGKKLGAASYRRVCLKWVRAYHEAWGEYPDLQDVLLLLRNPSIKLPKPYCAYCKSTVHRTSEHYPERCPNGYR